MPLTKHPAARALSCRPPLPQAFNTVFEKAIQRTAPANDIKQRVINLTDEITYSVYMYTARGLFERDKLIFLAQVAFQVMRANVWGFCCIILYVRLCWLRQVVLLLLWCCDAQQLLAQPLTPRPCVPGRL